MTLHPDDCMSLLELTEIKATSRSDVEARAHLLECPRCRLLLETLAGEEPSSASSQVDRPQTALFRLAARSAPEPPAGAPRTGDIYLAAGESSHTREVVVVIGRAPQRDDIFVVAPTSTALDAAADLDLTIHDSPLGYQHLVSVWAQGQVFADQLVEFVGRLERPDRERLVLLFDVTRGQAGERERGEEVGLPLQAPDDPRRTHQALLLDRFRRLYGPVDRALETLDAHRPLPTAAQTVGELVEAHFGETWDVSSLVSVARVARADIDRIRRDELDLTDRADVGSLAAVLFALEVPVEDAEAPVRRTLELVPGGERVAAGGGATRMAARSHADVDEATRTRDLYRDQSEVDTSAEARRRAADRYWSDLADELEERSSAS